MQYSNWSSCFQFFLLFKVKTSSHFDHVNMCPPAQLLTVCVISAPEAFFFLILNHIWHPTKQCGQTLDCFLVTVMCFMLSLISFHDNLKGNCPQKPRGLPSGHHGNGLLCPSLCSVSPASLSTTVSCWQACMSHTGIQLEVKPLRITQWYFFF